MSYRTCAPFILPGKSGWRWLEWVNEEPNVHAAVRAKADELMARAWCAGQARHQELGFR